MAMRKKPRRAWRLERLELVQSFSCARASFLRRKGRKLLVDDDGDFFIDGAIETVWAARRF
jgi:hypothetical protein